MPVGSFSQTSQTSPIAALEIQLGWIVACVLVWIATRLIATALLEWRGHKIQRERLKTVVSAVELLTRTVEVHEKSLADIRREQVKCRLSAERCFATRGELMRAIVDQTSVVRRFEDKLDKHETATSEEVSKIHGRVTDLATEVAEIRGAFASKIPNLSEFPRQSAEEHDDD